MYFCSGLKLLPMNDRILYPELTMQHSVALQTRFSDYDMFGHINNNSYMAFFDIGKTEFFRSVMGDACTPTQLSAVIVNINVDFLAPALAGEPLSVSTAVIHVGDRSFTLYQRIVNPDTLSVKAQQTATLAGFDIAAQSSAPLSPELRDRLSRL